MDQRTNNDLQNIHIQLRSSNTNPTTNGGEHNHLKCYRTLYGKYQREREVRKQM